MAKDKRRNEKNATVRVDADGGDANNSDGNDID
jgi:hypothetical protein